MTTYVFNIKNATEQNDFFELLYTLNEVDNKLSRIEYGCGIIALETNKASYVKTFYNGYYEQYEKENCIFKTWAIANATGHEYK